MEDKVCVITGASAGIGVGIAICMARAGFGKFVLIARRKDKLEEVAAACKKAGAKEVLVLAKDLSDLSCSPQIVKETINKFGRLDVLVSNAGIVHFEKAVDTKLEDFQWIVNFNLTMPFLIAREALPHLRKVKGNIVFISSDSGVRPDCGLIAYCASKGGLNQMARVMALEEAPNKVRVNLVSPGAILTDAMSSFYTGKSEDEIKKILHDMQPLPKTGMPEDIGETVAFVANNDKAAFVTGANFEVNGGVTLANNFGDTVDA